MMTGEEYFISYTQRDFNFALGLARDLRRKGVSVWMDQLNMPPGARYDTEVTQALSEASTILAIVSSEAVQSPHFLQEVSQGINQNKKIIAIALDNTSLAKAHPAFHIGVTTYDFSKDYEEAFSDLLERLESHSVLLNNPILAKNAEPGTCPPEMKRLYPAIQVDSYSPAKKGASKLPLFLLLLAAVGGTAFLWPDSPEEKQALVNTNLEQSTKDIVLVGTQVEESIEEPLLSASVAIPSELPTEQSPRARLKAGSLDFKEPKTATRETRPNKKNVASESTKSKENAVSPTTRTAVATQEAAWQRARTTGTLDSLQSFLANHPTGPHFREALSLLEKLRRDNQDTQKDVHISTSATTEKRVQKTAATTNSTGEPDQGTVTNTPPASILATSAVRNMKPATEQSSFAAGNTVYVWAKVSLKKAQKVTFEWLREGNERPLRNRSIHVPASAGYRIYDGLPLEQPGRWGITLRDASNNVLGEVSVDVQDVESDTQ